MKRPALTIALAAAAALLPAAPSFAQASTDPLTGEQWAFSPSAIASIPGAWAVTRGEGIVVAVVDSGAKLDHPDLAPNTWTNFREVPGNQVDDDGNGYVDDVHGIDLTNTNPLDQTPDDEDGHGTHVAGTIAGATNGKGVVGVAPKAKVMHVKVLDGQGRGTTSGVAEGVRYAAANGAKVINMSLNGPSNTPDLQQAIQFANSAGTLVICSAGNEGKDIDQVPSFPVSLPEPNLIGVAATAPAGGGKSLAGISNFGRLTVPIAAPGQEVLSASKTGDYELRTGTSMATPHVAGVAALVAAVKPGISAPDLRSILLQNATAASGVAVGSGYLDAAKAVAAASGTPAYALAQKPVLKSLGAVATKPKGGVSQFRGQFSLTGAIDGVAGYRLVVDKRTVATLTGQRSPFTVNLRLKTKKAPKRLQVIALDRARKPVTKVNVSIKVAATLPKKVGGGSGIARAWTAG
ncbi:MAG: S8 family serine peptidase [Solirubrobacteraceae bacterium]|jgi:subtilisin family serine protease|nr:S8 family serine peptidase [Solirubrobacteraceae bacterium]